MRLSVFTYATGLGYHSKVTPVGFWGEEALDLHNEVVESPIGHVEGMGFLMLLDTLATMG